MPKAEIIKVHEKRRRRRSFNEFKYEEIWHSEKVMSDVNFIVKLTKLNLNVNFAFPEFYHFLQNTYSSLNDPIISKQNVSFH